MDEIGLPNVDYKVIAYYTLSPTLFRVFFNDLIAEVKQLGHGLEILKAEKLSILVYADDVVVLGTTEVKLQEKLDVVARWGNKKVFLEKKLRRFLFINVSDVQYFLVNMSCNKW